MSGRAQIVFVKFGRFSNTNARISTFLRASFPEFDIEIIDILPYLKTHVLTTIVAVCETVLRCRMALFDRRRSVKASLLHGFLRSPVLRRLVEARLQTVIPQQYPRVRFILVSQTLFGCSVDDVPTFVYTDSAALTNLYAETFSLADLPPAAWLAQERAFLRRAARVFTWSHHVTRSLVELYHLPEAKVERLLAGCNLETLPTAPSPAPSDNKTILFVGVEWERKGGPLLIEAFARLPSRHADAHLIIVGCSPKLRTTRCTVRGRLDLADMGACYASAAIFCLPTRSEPFGIAFIEAMSHAVATVAPRMGAMPDYIEHGVTGRLHRPGDVDDITEQLTWLLDHPEDRRAIAARGVAAVQEYRWEKVGPRMRQAVEADFASSGKILVD